MSFIAFPCGYISLYRDILTLPYFKLPSGIIVGFDPTAYSVTEGVDGSVALRVVKTGSAAIPVTAVVTTQPGSAGGLG